MRAILRDHYGDTDVLRVAEANKPVPKKNEVLVRVRATTVNRTDIGHLTGKPYAIRLFSGLVNPRNKIPGTDFAGEVEGRGEDVCDFEIGDCVWGLNDNGLKSHAQYMCIRADKAIARIPEGYAFEEAVACAEGAHYAINFINKVELNDRDKVLVNGATGAIGSAAVQLLKAKNVYVTAVCGTAHQDLVKSLGADRVRDYQKEDFTKDDERYNYVCDAVGKSSFGATRHLLIDKGIYISSELGPGSENLYLPLTTRLKGGKRVIFPIPSRCRDSILYITQLMSKGAFKAVIDSQFSMNEIVKAYARVKSGQKVGNVILKID